jgi:hypothetical protein
MLAVSLLPTLTAVPLLLGRHFAVELALELLRNLA